MHISFTETGNDPVKSTNDLVNDPVKSTILNYLTQKPDATYNELAEKIGCSTATIKRHIQKLKNAGALERIGSDKNGFWRVV